MIDRHALVVQMAKVLVGESMLDQAQPSDEVVQHADEALARVEIYLGAEIEEAKEILTRVLEDVS